MENQWVYVEDEVHVIVSPKHSAASGVAFNTWCLQRKQNCIRPAGGMDALKGSRKLLSGSGFPVRSINDSSCSRVQTEICSQLLGFIEQGCRAAARSLLAFLTGSRCLLFLSFVSILFPVFSDYRSIYPSSFRSFFVRHCSPVLCPAVASV